MKFTKKGLSFSIITGLITGIIAWQILMFLGTVAIIGFSVSNLIWLIPILWILGVNLGYFLGKWINFFNQFGRFAAVGFTNAAVDFGVLNLLIAYSGITAGIAFSFFKAGSFLVALLHSYVWNKFWVFDASESGGGAIEFTKFFVTAVVSIAINVGVASFIVNLVSPVFGLSPEQWANVGAIFGSASALILNFVGLKLAVFKVN